MAAFFIKCMVKTYLLILLHCLFVGCLAGQAQCPLAAACTPGSAPASAAAFGMGLYRVQLAAIEHSEGVEGVVTVSVGVCAWDPAAHEQPDDLVRAADRALYVAKASGRNMSVIDK